MKPSLIGLVLVVCLSSLSATCYAKDLSPAELEVKQLTAQLKEKRQALKETKKAERLQKAEAAVAKATERLQKLRTAGN